MTKCWRTGCECKRFTLRYAKSDVKKG